MNRMITSALEYLASRKPWSEEKVIVKVTQLCPTLWSQADVASCDTVPITLSKLSFKDLCYSGKELEWKDSQSVLAAQMGSTDCQALPHTVWGFSDS